MLTVTTRPMTADERAVVESEFGQVQAAPGGCYIISDVGCGMVASALVVLLLHGFLHVPGWIALALFAAGTLISFLIGRRAFRLSTQERGRPYRRDLEQGTVEVIDCTVLDAVMLESADPADGAPVTYFLDVGDSRLLHVFPMEAEEAEPDEPARFPTRELRLTRTSHAGMCLGLECVGEVIGPSRVRDALDRRVEYSPRWGEILPGTLATLEADLRRLAEERPANY